MIKVDLQKAKALAHDVRRAKRNEKFAPLDIKATIPGEAVEAENQRQVIRETDQAAQLLIDDAVDVDELKQTLNSL